MYYTQLHSRGLLAISGEDTIPFLQGLITNNADRLKDGKPVYAALLSPQGKYLHDFFLIPAEGKILVDGERARSQDLLQRLKMYKLRSKVTIEALPDAMGVVAAWGGQAKDLCEDPRLSQLGYRMAGDAAALLSRCKQQGWQHVDDLAYDRMRLELGVPDGSRDMQPDRAIILYFGFEDLRGIDFSKGCYVGQEVMARAHYRGSIKKFLYQVISDNALPPPGTPVMRGEVQAGDLLSSEGNIGLALLKVEDVEASPKLTAGNIALTATFPGWVRQKPEAFAAKQ